MGFSVPAMVRVPLASTSRSPPVALTLALLIEKRMVGYLSASRARYMLPSMVPSPDLSCLTGISTSSLSSRAPLADPAAVTSCFLDLKLKAWRVESPSNQILLSGETVMPGAFAAWAT
ncbi:hypothetical protein D3C86_1824120 [compost metagenome]